jgi:hypothetical protein
LQLQGRSRVDLTYASNPGPCLFVSCTCPISPLERELIATAPNGRDAVALARADSLLSACTAEGAEFIAGLIRHDHGVQLAPSTVETLVRALPLPAVRRAVKTLGDSLVMGLRYLLDRLEPRDLLGVVAAVRDGHAQPFAYTTQTNGLLALLFGLASETGERSGASLHRHDAAETVMLFGAARRTDALLVDLHRVRIIRSVVLNSDASVLAWALANPFLDRASRAFVVSLSSPVVLLDLFDRGLLDMADLVAWASSRTTEESPSLAASVFLLDRPLEQVRPLALAVLRFSVGPEEFLTLLPPAGRRRALQVLAGTWTPQLEETFFALLPGWAGSTEELLAASEHLLGD